MQVGVSSSFDVALWFLARAEREKMPMPPGKLHALMFYAQAYYAGATKGRRLMPSVFVATEVGPRDPNLYRAFENGIPAVETDPLPTPVARFLERIWFEYGPVSPAEISRLISRSAIWREVYRPDAVVEVTPEVMHRHFGRKSTADAGVQRAVGERFMIGGRPGREMAADQNRRTADGRGGGIEGKTEGHQVAAGQGGGRRNQASRPHKGRKWRGLSLADLGFGRRTRR